MLAEKHRQDIERGRDVRRRHSGRRHDGAVGDNDMTAQLGTTRGGAQQGEAWAAAHRLNRVVATTAVVFAWGCGPSLSRIFLVGFAWAPSPPIQMGCSGNGRMSQWVVCCGNTEEQHRGDRFPCDV